MLGSGSETGAGPGYRVVLTAGICNGWYEDRVVGVMRRGSESAAELWLTTDSSRDGDPFCVSLLQEMISTRRRRRED